MEYRPDRLDHSGHMQSRDPHLSASPERPVEGVRGADDAPAETSWFKKLFTPRVDADDYKQKARQLDKDIRSEQYQFAKQQKLDERQREKDVAKKQERFYRDAGVESLELSLKRNPGSPQIEAKYAQAKARADKEFARWQEIQKKELQREHYAQQREWREKRREGLSEIQDKLIAERRTGKPTPPVAL